MTMAKTRAEQVERRRSALRKTHLKDTDSVRSGSSTAASTSDMRTRVTGKQPEKVSKFGKEEEKDRKTKKTEESSKTKENADKRAKSAKEEID